MQFKMAMQKHSISVERLRLFCWNASAPTEPVTKANLMTGLSVA